MATAEELLASDKTLVVDSDLRTIVIPKSVTNLGVESDDGVLVVPFQMPSEYCGIDLSTFDIKINYLNANVEPDAYEVTDAIASDGVINFTWLVGRSAAMYKGAVKFNVCLRDIDENGEVRREFNTTVASLPVLEGLETGEQIAVVYNDILEQWRRELFGAEDSAVSAIQSARDTALGMLRNAESTVSAQINATRDEALSEIDAARESSVAYVNHVLGTALEVIADGSY